MKILAWMALSAVALTGCVSQQGSIDPQQAAQAAANPPELDAVLEQLEPNEGKPLGGGLLLRDARADAGRLVIDLQLSDGSLIATPSLRSGFIAGFEEGFGEQLCQVPTLRSYVAARGGVTATLAAPDGSRLASRTIDRC